LWLNIPVDVHRDVALNDPSVRAAEEGELKSLKNFIFEAKLAFDINAPDHTGRQCTSHVRRKNRCHATYTTNNALPRPMFDELCTATAAATPNMWIVQMMSTVCHIKAYQQAD
jgi:hypothetical protein